MRFMRLLYINEKVLYLILLSTIILNIFNAMVCVAQLDTIAVKTTPSSQDRSTIAIGSIGSPERAVNINKILIPEKEFYFPGEQVSVFVEIQFLKYKMDEWKLENFTVDELIDENLGVDNKSVRWAVIDNVSDMSKYKTNKFKRTLCESANVSWTNANFKIAMPNDIDSVQEFIYWYNITLNNTGVFDTDTIVDSGKNVDFYRADTSLRINVINYSFFSPFWEYLKEIIWTIIIFSGVFTFYNMIVSRRRRPIHIDEFLRGMIKDLKKLLTSIPPFQIALVSSILFFILSYSYISSLYPQRYYPIGLLIISHWDFITGIGPMIMLIFITAILLIINRPHPGNLIKQAIMWFINMPPLVAYLLAMLFYTIPIILLIIMY